MRLPLPLLIIPLLLAGCATAPAPRKGAHADLYQGRAEAVYATRLPPADAAEAEARGDTALREGNSDLALFEYVQGLDMEPNAERFYKVGRIHEERQNLELAARAYRLALGLDENHPRALEGLGLMQLRNREYRRAEETLLRAVAADAGLWRACNGLGVIADLDGKQPQAEEWFAKAAALQPNRALLHNNRGYSKYLGGDLEGAVQEFRRALQIDHGFTKAWQNLGLAEGRRGDYREAVSAFAHTMDKAAAYNNVGFICLSKGEYTLAERFFREAAKLSPRYYDAAYRNLEQVRAQQARGERGP